jgi:predicted ATPase
MKLKFLKIKKFRHIENQTIEFGDSLTVISGLNGTGKSSILGLAGHFFTSPDKTKKSLLNKDFATKQSDVFKLCPEHDYHNTYEYEGLIEENPKTELIPIKVSTRYMPTENRLKFDINGRKNKYPHPVIYLGLKRLFPNADEVKFNTSNSDLSKTDKKFYINEVKNIMVMNDKQHDVERVITQNKNFLGIKTEQYAAAGNSAGQDNLGQIITAIMSFKNLFNNGGILLIDEIEATLFPAAQLNLIKRLYKYAQAYKLQIIFTTHSLEIMKFLFDKNYPDVKINFLELSSGKVVNRQNATFDYIQHKIRVEARQEKTIENIKQIICEDELAALWIRGLTNRTDISKSIQINYDNMNDGCIKQLAESKMKCFDNFIFVLDGDCRNKEEYKRIKNVVFLPGEDPPEMVMFKFLKALPDDDKFWENEQLFDYNVCFNGYMDNPNDINRHKNWYNEKRMYLGRGLSKFFKKWKKDNQYAYKEFLSDISKHL